MNELIKLTAFVDEMTVASTNAIIGVIRARKTYQNDGQQPSLKFLNNNQWYRSLSKEEKQEFRRLAMLYITAG